MLFRAHFMNAWICREYERLREESGDRDVYLLYDVDRGPAPELPGVVAVDVERLRRARLGTRDLWRNGDHPLIDFHERCPGYERIWMIEYDVRCRGPWHRLFDHFESDPADLLAGYLRCYDQERQWPAWGAANREFPRAAYRRCFFPVVRLSRRAAARLAEEYRRGLNGFCEFVVPTLLHACGQSLKDLNGAGLEVYSRRSFRFRPSLRGVPAGRGLLIHPVREELSRREALAERIAYHRRRLGPARARRRLLAALEALRERLRRAREGVCV